MAAVREVNLYGIDDPLFRAHLARIAKARRPGASNPLSRAYQVALLRWEGAVRRIVAEMAGFLDSKKRILGYWASSGDGRWQKRFREFDMVGWEGGHPLLACEIKLRERVGAEGGMQGRGQLLSALEVARLRWPKVRGLLMSPWLPSLACPIAAKPRWRAGCQTCGKVGRAG